MPRNRPIWKNKLSKVPRNRPIWRKKKWSKMPRNRPILRKKNGKNTAKSTDFEKEKWSKMPRNRPIFEKKTFFNFWSIFEKQKKNNTQPQTQIVHFEQMFMFFKMVPNPMRMQLPNPKPQNCFNNCFCLKKKF